MVNTKKVLYGSLARKKLMAGVDFIAGAVKLTLGCFGQNFFIEKGNRVTNDGVTVAKEVWLKDELEQRGVVAVQQAADKTNNEAGDGTTTAVVLTQAILHEADRRIGDKPPYKKAPIDVMKEIENECDEVLSKLKKTAKKIETKEELVKSATVAVENEELGKLIGEAQWELGEDGVILAEEDAGRETVIEIVSGIRIDNGFGTSLVINNQEKGTLEIKNVPTILTSYTVHDLTPFIRVNEMQQPKIIDQLFARGNREICIVARAFTPEAIRLCQENSKRGLYIYPINAPYENQASVMKDMAAVLGGTFYHDEASSLEDMQLSDIGLAQKISAGRWSATFTGKFSKEQQGRIRYRLTELEQEYKGEKSDFMKKKLRERIAQLKGGFGVLKVTGVNEIERKYRYDKCADAVNAVRVALQTGTCKGAGIAYKEVADALPDSYILKRPLMSIYEQIKSTAPEGWEPEEWVRDPYGVLECALRNACSVAGTVSTAAGLIVSERPKNRVVELQDKEEEHE